MTCQCTGCGAAAVTVAYLEDRGRELRLCREHALESSASYTLEVFA